MKPPHWLTTLRERGTAAHSSVQGSRSKDVLDTLVTLGLVRIETRASRRVIVCTDPDTFSRWLEATYPENLDDAERPRRATNIALRGASKLGRSTHDVQPLVLRWFGDTKNNPWAQLTQAHGIAALTTDHVTQLKLPATWWLLTVENWESFYTLSYNSPPAPLIAVLLDGNPSEVLLSALGKLHPPQYALHFGDYDWAGLSIFQRLRRHVANTVLYIPEQIELIFQRHRNRRLLVKQSIPVSFTDDAAGHCIAELIARHNGGVEQEIVPQPSYEYFSNAGRRHDS